MSRMTTDDPTCMDEFSEKIKKLVDFSKSIESVTDTITRVFNPIVETINNIYNSFTPGHRGQGTVYNLLSIYYEKERTTDSLPIRTTTEKIKPTFTRKTTRSTIHPVRNKSWKGKR